MNIHFRLLLYNKVHHVHVCIFITSIWHKTLGTIPAPWTFVDFELFQRYIRIAEKFINAKQIAMECLEVDGPILLRDRSVTDKCASLLPATTIHLCQKTHPLITHRVKGNFRVFSLSGISS